MSGASAIREIPGDVFLNSDLFTPTYFTMKEGGNWIKWKGGGMVSKEDLSKRVDMNKYHWKQWIQINNRAVHSLLFGTPATGRFARWDCVKGFTSVPGRIVY